MFVIECQYIHRYDEPPRAPFIYSHIYVWGGEVKIHEAIKGHFEPKKYSSVKRAEQGIKSLDNRASTAYDYRVIPEKDAEW